MAGLEGKKETRGGTRRNAGAKPKYNEEAKLSEWSVK